MKKHRKSKPVNYLMISTTNDDGRPLYEMLYTILDEHHQDLSAMNPRIVLAWATAWTADVDGRIKLGQCKRASDLDRELAPYDFVILLNRAFWENPQVSDHQRRAVLDHELMHAAVVYDTDGTAKVDARGRTVFRLRKHDLEEFAAIAERHGCWKRDIEAFAVALDRAERSTATTWVGFTALHTTLKDIGVDVPLDVIAAWSDHERREVMTWSLLRQDAGVTAVNLATAGAVPSCLAVATMSAPHA
jgi:hypothetical protein